MSPLTAREVETLNYIAQGYHNKQIAIELGISEHTVKNHVTSILCKLNTNARTDAVVLAIKQGLISMSKIADQLDKPRAQLDESAFSLTHR
ncbi:HTH-type transcriptional regulator MalT [subsurface metagenome]